MQVIITQAESDKLFRKYMTLIATSNAKRAAQLELELATRDEAELSDAYRKAIAELGAQNGGVVKSVNYETCVVELEKAVLPTPPNLDKAE